MATITSTQDGNANATSTWVGGIVPGAQDDVIFGNTITCTANTAWGTLTNSGGGTIKISDGKTLTIYGQLDLGQDGIIGEAAGANSITLELGGNVIIAAGSGAAIGNGVNALASPSMIIRFIPNRVRFRNRAQLR